MLPLALLALTLTMPLVTLDTRAALAAPRATRQARTPGQLAFRRMLLPRNTRTLARLDRVQSLDLTKLHRLTGVALRGVIFDIDQTLTAARGRIPEAAFAHLAKLVGQGVEVGVYSNAKKLPEHRLADLQRLRDIGVKVMTDSAIAPKPAVGGFRQAARALGLAPSQVAMVGDNYLSDGGAARAGLHFIKVKPVKTDWSHLRGRKRLQRYKKRAQRGFYDLVARFHDLLRKSPAKLTSGR